MSKYRACPAVQHIDAIWSIRPTGAPTYWFSARCARRATSAGSTEMSRNPSRATAVAQSNAADEERPAPDGRSDSTSRFAPPISYCASRNTHAAPAGYAAQSPTEPGLSESRSNEMIPS
jgi:hypothetical protein